MKRLAFLLILMASLSHTQAQQPAGPLVRIARLIIDPSQTEAYRPALKEEIETSVRVEPGVLSLQAVYDQANPAHVTVFEVYADRAAYEAHIKTPHFLRYKTMTQSMVKSLELSDVIAMERKKEP